MQKSLDPCIGFLPFHQNPDKSAAFQWRFFVFCSAISADCRKQLAT